MTMCVQSRARKLHADKVAAEAKLIAANRERMGLPPNLSVFARAPRYFKCETCNGSGCGDGDNGACLECNGFGEVRELD